MANYTNGYEQLAAQSYQIQREVEATGSVITTVKYVPTDLDYDGTAELLKGWSEKPGTCPVCRFLRSANGSCDCS